MGDVRSGAASAGSSNKWAILFTVLIMTFMATLDSSIVNVALPVMQKALGAGLDQIQWISSVYLLTMCGGTRPNPVDLVGVPVDHVRLFACVR